MSTTQQADTVDRIETVLLSEYDGRVSGRSPVVAGRTADRLRGRHGWDRLPDLHCPGGGGHTATGHGGGSQRI
jgi:hypothetical protein